MTLGDRIVILNGGEVQQVDSPMNLYTRPANRFVAGFIGNPAMNFVEGAVEAGNFRAGGLQLAVGDRAPTGPAVLGIRPEDVVIDANAPLLIEAAIDVVEPMGHETMVHFEVNGHTAVARLAPDFHGAPGERLRLGARPGSWHLFAPGGRGERMG